MNLIFRLLYVVLTASRRGRLGPLDESVVRFQVLPNDLDLNLHMNNGRYLTLCDLGRIDLMLRLGVAGTIRRNKWVPVVASLTARYRRALAPFARYELRTRVLAWDERFFYLEQRFTRRGEIAALALVKARFTGPHGGVEPQAIVRATQHDVSSPPIPPAVVQWQEAESRLAAGGEPALSA
jgi:acyl-CoA thioesterase FadM